MRLLLTCLACATALVPPTQPRQRLTVAHNVASAKPNARNAKYVDQLLDVAAGTDRGVRAKEGTRTIIDGLIARLERSYKGADASETPEWLYRDSEVVYVGQRSSKRANAAGGRFRGRIGRLLFRTTALYQHIQKDGESLRAVNANRFRFLGLLPGCAVLRGSAEKENDLEALSAKFDRTLSENTLRASFERPKIAFGPLVFEVGPSSVVRLDTTYLDDRVLNTARKITNRDRSRTSTLLWDVDLARTDMRQEAPSGAHRDRETRPTRARLPPPLLPIIDAQVRISRGGSSGTPFVFRACSDTDTRKDAWKRVAEATPVSAKTAGVGVGALAAVAAGTAARIGTKNVAFAPAVVLALASAKLLTSTGGIVVTRDPATMTYKNAGQGG